jgi:MoxR-like ATPase
MQERQVTIGEQTYPLPRPFLVMATQNPIEQEGTYPLPEAQVDRFMLKVTIDYPTRDEELLIMRQQIAENVPIANAVVSADDILRARMAVHAVYMDEKIERYILDIVEATRRPQAFNLDRLYRLYLLWRIPPCKHQPCNRGKVHAFIQRRGYVIPEDIRAICFDVLRHRVAVTYEAEAEEMTSAMIIQEILDTIEVP